MSTLDYAKIEADLSAAIPGFADALDGMYGDKAGDLADRMIDWATGYTVEEIVHKFNTSVTPLRGVLRSNMHATPTCIGKMTDWEVVEATADAEII